MYWIRDWYERRSRRTSTTPTADPSEQLKKLGKLRDTGVLTP
jgi:hypothetical protein